MDSNDDPFPPSLPRFKSSTEMGAFPPEYIDQARSLDHPLHSTYSRDPDLSFDSLNPIYISHDLSGSPNFQPQKHCKDRDGQQRGNMVGTIQPKFFTSPSSSPLDSSSDSSARRQSETSSDSSGSALQGGDGPALDDCRPSRDAPETILEMGISDEMSDVNLSSASALDLRDLDMEKMFNFPSASSNSNLYANSNTATLSPRNMKVPFRPSSGHRPMAKRRRGHRPGASEVSTHF